MANAEINLVGVSETGLIRDLYNEVFQPRVETEFFEHRFHERSAILNLIADLDRRPVGFSCGYEYQPGIWFCWLVGVLPAFRGIGVASQLFEAQLAWAGEHGYYTARLECSNEHRPGLSLALSQGFKINGICWDDETHCNLVIFGKELGQRVGR